MAPRGEQAPLALKFRRWERGDWSIAVGVPDSVAARARRVVGGRLGTAVARVQRGTRLVNVDAQGRALALADPPPVRIERHDPQASLDLFLAHAPPQVGEPDADPNEAIAAESWYHTIELPGGIVTEGRFDHRPLLPHYGLPEDMAGMRALDVGTADGFWAFEMERRGAEVVAVELPRMSARDFPAGALRFIPDHADTPPGHRFELARRALGSSVELVRSAVYDIDPSSLGSFDFVHVGDLLLHLRDPVRALAAVRSVTSGEAHIADAADAWLGGGRDDVNLTQYRGGWYSNIWWTPSVQTLAQMVVDAGFSDVKVLRMYRLAIRGGPAGWRAILRARA